MTFRKAKKLHKGDEVTIKRTGEIVTIISAYTDYVGNKLKVIIETCSSNYGYITLLHTEIK